jgi:thiamine-monophosphate kinase
LSSYSEFDLITFLRQRCRRAPRHLKTSIGDDCAVFAPAFAHRMVCTSDLLVEGFHFRKEWISPQFLGRKACLVNLSDLAAMGARPYACLLNLALEPAWLSGQVQALIESFVSEAEERNMPLIGGDLSRSDRLFVSVTALGYVKSGEPLLRSTARPGDAIFLIGDLGYSRLGLQLLKETADLDLSGIAGDDELRRLAGSEERYRCLKAHLCPPVHAEEAVWFQENQAARAMIDVSDGLAADLRHILDESGVAAEIDVEALPSLEGIDSQDALLALLLDGGEDYALLFTASPEMQERIAREYPRDWSRPSLIGRVVDGPPRLILVRDGKRRTYEPRGFDHFQ